MFAPVVFRTPPREPQYFSNLFESLNRAETQERGVTRAMPYSVSFMIESDGLSVMTFRSIGTQLLAATSESNRNVNLATRSLKERKRDGECIVKLRMCAMTWASNTREGVTELSLRKSKLIRILEGWGNPTIIERTGNPMLPFQSNCLGLTSKHVGKPCPAPLREALAIMPFTRPASPFPRGSTIYRSLDGKILRYERFSSEQTTWITLIAGKPGVGKSVLMNNNNVEACLLPGLTKLPWIGIVDIGISCAGFTDLIRDSLPEHMKHLVVYKRLQNSAEWCINPLDTPLGLRKPLPKDRVFMTNFITILVTPAERGGKPYEGMSSFVGHIIDLAFKHKSDILESAQPTTYKRGHHPVIDRALEESGYRALPATTYWAITDHLFDEGQFHAAEVAQRYAVPTLNDLIQVASNKALKEEYEDMNIETGASIVNAFITGLRSAISDFPLFSQATKFDLGSARIVALDLQDVAIIGSEAAKKQTATMFMMARQCFMKKVAFSKEDLPAFDLRYKDYYERLISEIVDEYKLLEMDEYHKTGGHEVLNLQMETDGRESRKWNMEIVLASQMMQDFGQLVNLATSIFVLDGGTAKTRDWMRENIGMTPVEESALVNYVHGGNVHGATFLARFVTKTATYSQLFTLTIGPMRLWSLSTTAEDRKLRALLYDKLPLRSALRLLAKRFPSGGCKSTVARLKEQMFNGADFIDDAMETSVIQTLADDMIREYSQNEIEYA